jgi:hypothetical protein
MGYFPIDHHFLQPNWFAENERQRLQTIKAV